MGLSQNAAQRQSCLLRHNFSQFLPAAAIQVLRLYRFSDGEYLCREGAPTRFLLFLVEGRCKVTRSLQNGKESLICFYQDFAILGEIELVCALPSATEPPALINTVQATGAVQCLALPIKTAQDLLLNDPLFLRFLCPRLAQKLMQNNQTLSINLHYPVDQRLASYIFCSCPSPGNLFQENHTHLAEYLGCSHRQLLRVLRRFREEGILAQEDGVYRVMDVDRLKKLADDIYSP